MVIGGAEAGIAAGFLNLLLLRGDRRNSIAAGDGFVFGSGTGIHAAFAAVVADANDVCVVVDDGGAIDDVDDVDVHVVDRAVVEKVALLPATTVIAVAEIPIAVIDAAVKAYVRAPIAFIENKAHAIPAPVGRSPEITGSRGHNPCARDPVIIAGVPSPVAGNPDKAFLWAGWLDVDRKRGRSKADRDADIGTEGSGEGEQDDQTRDQHEKRSSHDRTSY